MASVATGGFMSNVEKVSAEILPEFVTELDATAYFNTVRKEEAEYIIFDGELDGELIYEIWYKADGEYNVSFVTYDSKSGFRYLDSITVLIHRTAKARNRLTEQLRLAKEGRLRVYVASAAFLASLFAFLWILTTQKSDATIVAAVVGVVASGASFFFGSWIPGKGSFKST